MPTARELLDQADALMRRNRPATGAAAAAEEGIPTLTDAVPSAHESAPREAPSARALLREEAANELEDVPLLTDAVEEIEAPSILEEPPEPDDVESWDDTLTGAHTIIPASPLELPAPPTPQPAAAAPPPPTAPVATVGVLPEEWVATPPAHVGPTLVVETIDIPPPRADAVESEQPPAPALKPSAPESSMAAPSAPEPSAPEAPAAKPVAAQPPAFAAQGSTDETVPDVVADAPDETQPATPFEWPAASAATTHEPHVPAESAAPAPAVASTQPSSPAAASASAAEDEARWSALAEEIRMQVLQRIDLFTDTGLREQLGARLQPIVDRASADLVATINQHVGVLLRAYVAEAIEREIERWRAERR